MSTLSAHAKINLILSVSAPDESDGPAAGFHYIASWFVGLSLRDDVTIERTEGARSEFSIAWAADAPRPTPIDWPVEKDLAFRAHRLLEQELNRPLPARIRIEKRIPVGSGLGGGSSDAASVLLGLNRIFELGLTPEALIAAAMKLGSDVAYFVSAGEPPVPAIVTGLGETIEPADAVPGDVIVIIPPYGCPTGPVYKAYDRVLIERAQAEPTRREAIANEDLLRKRMHKITHALSQGKDVPSELLFNDLAIPAFRVEPRLGHLVTTLSNTVRVPVHVTGSGSCLFIIPPRAKADRIMERVRAILSQAEPGAVVLRCGMIDG